MALTLGYERFVRESTDSNGNTVLVLADGNRIYAPGVGKSIACLGDSLTFRNTATATDTTAYQAHGYMAWANFLLGRKRMWFPVANNFGYSGETSTTIKDHIADVIAVQPDYCVVLIGINDVAAGTAFATIKANLQEIYNGLLNAGITPIAMTIWPDAYASIDNSTERPIKYRVNTFIRETALRDKRILLCDPFDIMVDHTSASGAPKSGYLVSDNLHPTNTGAYWAGYALAQTLDAVLPTTPTAFSTQADLYDATLNPTGNLVVNGMLDGSDGTFSGAGVSEAAADNGVATSWVLERTGTTAGGTSTCVASKDTVTLANGSTIPRQVLTVVCSGNGASAANERFLMYQYVNEAGGYITPGDQIYAECDVTVTGCANAKGIRLTLVDWNGTAIAETAADLYPLTEGLFLPSGDWAGTMRTPVITLAADAGTRQLRVQFYTAFDGSTASGDAGAVIKFSRLSVRKVVDV